MDELAVAADPVDAVDDSGVLAAPTRHQVSLAVAREDGIVVRPRIYRIVPGPASEAVAAIEAAEHVVADRTHEDIPPLRSAARTAGDTRSHEQIGLV